MNNTKSSYCCLTGFLFLTLLFPDLHLVAGQDTLVDVFPLSVGRGWRYSYSYSFNNIETGLGLTIGGTLLVSVEAKSIVGDTLEWHCVEHDSLLVHQYKAFTEPHDTSYNQQEEHRFVIRELPGEKHALYLDGGRRSFIFFDGIYPDSSTICRYQAVNDSGYKTVIQRYSHVTGTFRFEQNLGAISLKEDAPNMFSSEHIYEELLDTMTVNPDGVGQILSMPPTYVLSQNYPNPFNPITVIAYALPFESRVTLTIYNTLGQQIGTLVDGIKPAGNKSVTFNGSGLSSGVYFYRLSAIATDGKGQFTDVKRLLLVK